LAFDPDDAAAIQSEGRVNDARTVPLSAVATDAGAAPVRIFKTALVPMVVSIASSIALRTATESCKAISDTPLGSNIARRPDATARRADTSHAPHFAGRRDTTDKHAN
jgi:hypothetical protein